MQTIGGYLIVEHGTANGWHHDTATHAVKDKDTAAEYVRARIEEISNRHFDEDSGDSESNPTIHAVSPALFDEVQDRLSQRVTFDLYMFELGSRITRQILPSYKVGEAKVFCTKSESVEAPTHPNEGRAGRVDYRRTDGGSGPGFG